MATNEGVQLLGAGLGSLIAFAYWLRLDRAAARVMEAESKGEPVLGENPSFGERYKVIRLKSYWQGRWFARVAFPIILVMGIVGTVWGIIAL
jgi:hypothetical protein